MTDRGGTPVEDPGENPGSGGSSRSSEAPVGTGRPDMADDEQAILDEFARLAPEGTIGWAFDDSMRRLSSPGERSTWIEPWPGLPPDLWARGRGTRASERILGDVLKAVAQNLTEYTQRLVDDVRRTAPEESAVFDALRFLAARVGRLEAAADPLGIRPAELALATPDLSEWAGEVVSWLGGMHPLPVVVGELTDRSVFEALVASGASVDGVDPRGAVVWAAEQEAAAVATKVDVTLADVVDHLQGLAPNSRSAIVLSGCIDRATVAGNVDLADAALRVLVPGGTLVLLVSDQTAWDAGLESTVRDLLPGRPLHPETWAMILARRGVDAPAVHPADSGAVHALVARSGL